MRIVVDTKLLKIKSYMSYKETKFVKINLLDKIVYSYIKAMTKDGKFATSYSEISEVLGVNRKSVADSVASFVNEGVFVLDIEHESRKNVYLSVKDLI